MVIRIYSEGNCYLKGYVYDSNNNLVTYDTVTTSQVNLYYYFRKNVEYTIKIVGESLGSYTINTSYNIGKHIIKPNSISVFTNHIVYKDGLNAEGYFTNTEDAKDFIDEYSTTWPEFVVETGTGLILGKIWAPLGVIEAIGVSYYEVNKIIFIQNIKDDLNEEQGNPVYIQINGSLLELGVFNYIIAEWDQQGYNPDDIYEKDPLIEIDTY